MEHNRLLGQDMLEMDEISHAETDLVHVFSSTRQSSERVKAASYTPMAFNQCMINEGTDDELICCAYKETTLRKVLFYSLVLCTLGLILLVFYWKPEWQVWVRSVACDHESATHLILRDRYKRNHVKIIKRLEPIKGTGSTSDFNSINGGATKNGNVKPPKFSSLKSYFSLANISKQGLQPTRYFEHKFHKYLWYGETFVPLRGLDYDTTVHQLKDMGSGLSESDKPDRHILFGRNSITIEITPLISLLFREILNPYYAFQLFAIIIWVADEYYSLPAVLLVLSGISISLSLYLTRKQNRMIHKMSSGEGIVRVLVNGNFESRLSSELLPGDVIEVQANKRETLWCDCVLLSGNCVVSESMLTGESVPVLKTPLVSSDGDEKADFYNSSRHKQHTLYGGTKVVDVHHKDDGDTPKALVIRTGFYTEKGKMIESMLSPSPMDYKFYNDSLKFILVMAILGFIGSILTIIFLADLQASSGFIVMRVLDLITTVVPPGLPAALTIATIYAQRRLKKAKIFCISPPRIAISGKINCMCFDKTGTLTENNLKLWGIVPCSQDSGTVSFHDVVHDYQSLPNCGSTGKECLNALGSCHSLVDIDGEISGDPVDLELFRATNWKMRKSEEEWSSGCSCVMTSNDAKDVKLALARIFQFNSVMRRMSVVTKKANTNRVQVFVKGAPETIVAQCELCTVPPDFEEKLQYFTRQGYRVLALASRDLDQLKDISALERKHVESDLNFLGLVVMSNPLKLETTETITKLKDARIRTVMATGDNLETALYVARKCNMVKDSDKIVTVDAKVEDSIMKIKWTLDSTERKVSTMISHEGENGAHDFGVIESQSNSVCHLALSGDTLDLIRRNSTATYRRILMSATVLARMKPDHKRNLVEGLQELKYIVGMCGDGANDCGALKAAHSGVAIAEIEASIVAPFTSMNAGISCCVKLIREGRAALVTSFGMIKYLCVYCFLQYLSLIFLFRINSYLSDYQFLFADIAVTGAVTLFFAIGGAAKSLSKKQPHGSLVSCVMLTCLLLQIAQLVFFQTMAYIALQQQSWHTPLTNPNMTHPKENILCNENTVMFYTSNVQNMMLAFVFYKGLPYRQPLYKNVPYLVAYLILTIWVGIMFFAPVEPIADFFSLTQLNNEIGFKFILLAIYVGNLLCAILIEKVLLESDRFQRFLQKCTAAFRRFRRRKFVFDLPEEVSHVSLQREIRLDGTWPPVGQETSIKIVV